MNNESPVTLPIVSYEDNSWYFDARLHQIRNVENPHDYQDLDDFELAYFIELVK